MGYAYIVVPSKDRHGNAVPRTLRGSVLRSVETTIAKQFGGFTTIHGHGGWVADDGRTMVERISRVEAWIGDRDPTEVHKIMADLATIIGGRLNQASVMFGTFNGSASFHG